MKYIIQFDHRSDAGTPHVGPFDTSEEALAWLKRQTFDNTGNLARLEAPEPTEEPVETIPDPNVSEIVFDPAGLDALTGCADALLEDLR